MTDQYKLTTTITSESPGGVLNQRITVEEFSSDPALHIQKNMAVAEGVMAAFGGLVKQAYVDLKAVA